MPADSWKKRVRAMRTRGFLKHDRGLSPGEARKLEKLNSVQLAAAALNPTHSEQGQQAAQALLEKRGGRLEDAEIIVPGFVRPAASDILRRRFFGKSRAVRRWSGWLILLCFVLLFGAAGYSVETEDDALREGVDMGLITLADMLESHRELTAEEIENADPDALKTFVSETRLKDILLKKTETTPAGQRRKAAEQAGMAIAGALTVCGLVWFVFSVFRRQPARVLLLRKFNDKKLGKAMANVITTELRPFGHVMTLSDKHIKRSRFAFIAQSIPTNFAHAALIVTWFPIRMALRQFNRARWGPAWVGSARNYRCLARRLRDRMSLNLEVAFTSKREAFIVRTSDMWWKRVVALLIGSADVIVVDLSRVTAGTQWELERLERLGLFEQAILLAEENHADAARAAVEPYPAAMRRRLFIYDKLGDMDDQAAFREAMLKAISTNLRRKSSFAT